jgi:hypothetical protein
LGDIVVILLSQVLAWRDLGFLSVWQFLQHLSFLLGGRDFALDLRVLLVALGLAGRFLEHRLLRGDGGLHKFGGGLWELYLRGGTSIFVGISTEIVPDTYTWLQAVALVVWIYWVAFVSDLLASSLLVVERLFSSNLVYLLSLGLINHRHVIYIVM